MVLTPRNGGHSLYFPRSWEQTGQAVAGHVPARWLFLHNKLFSSMARLAGHHRRLSSRPKDTVANFLRSLVAAAIQLAAVYAGPFQGLQERRGNELPRPLPPPLALVSSVSQES